MTIGSPIGKHLVLWPEIWTARSGQALQGLAPAGESKIRWFNYADRGDPVGFDIGLAQRWMNSQDISAFQVVEDTVFSRYVLPGEAHVHYWKDGALFDRWFRQVGILPPRRAGHASATPRRPKALPDLALARFVAPVLPFLLSFACHAAGVYLLYKAVAGDLDAAHHVDRFTFQHVFALASLLFGVTTCSRIWRITPAGSGGPLTLGVLGLCIGAGPVLAFPDHFPLLTALGALVPAAIPDAPMRGAVALVAASSVLAALGAAPWRARWGRRVLLLAGSLCTAALCALMLVHVDGAAIWPLALAGALFIYAWWLGILTFDLSFLWVRHARQGAGLKRLARWYGRSHPATGDRPRAHRGPRPAEA
jgi:hypothetical protein